MKHKLEQAMEEVRDDFIRDAATYKKKRRFAPWLGAVAAVLAVVLIAGVLWNPANAPVAQAHGLLVAPQYPEMAAYPDFEDDTGFSNGFEAWHNSRKDQYDQPSGYADSLDGYFSQCLRLMLAETGGKNVACSPVNIYMALAMLAETTNGNSRAQLLRLLGADSIEALRTQASHVWNAHYCADGATALTLGNSIWLDEGIPYSESALSTLAGSYYASVYQGKLGSDAMNKALQSWLNEQTGGLLEEYAANETLPPETVFALASTIYYRVKWVDQFHDSANTDGEFQSPNGSVPCTFMNQCLTYGPYYYGEGFSAVALELEDGSKMWLVLPDEGRSTDDLLNGTLDDLLRGKTEQTSIRVNLSLPKFDISSGLEISKTLKKMGVTDVFDPTISDYSSLLPGSSGIFLGQASHAARVTIDEEGIEAAAYTVMAACGAAVPPEDEVDFILDRPFAFVIESQDGLPLFAGIVNQP